MVRRTFASASLVAALVFSALPGAAAAQDIAEPADDDKPVKSVTGTITKGDDGIWYLTPDEAKPDERIELNFGPSWFNDLDAFLELFESGTDGVTIGGNLRDGMPNENASDVAKAAAAKDPKIRILTVNDQKREGKPPWAGGPKGNVPPGQAKKATGNIPPGQVKKAASKVETSGAAQEPGQGRGKKDK